MVNLIMCNSTLLSQVRLENELSLAHAQVYLRQILMQVPVLLQTCAE